MKEPPSYQKIRGGYYTPKPVSNFLSNWAIQNASDLVLEPSCGDGAFLESAAAAMSLLGAKNSQIRNNLSGIELDLTERNKALEKLYGLNIASSSKNIINDDFFSICKNYLHRKRQFDAIIGNPPFIRYQNFPDGQREIAFNIMKTAGLHPSRLTNAWVPFVVASSLLLKKEGRLAMVLPAELLQVNYAAELRIFLSNYYSKINIVTFKTLLFDEIQQEVILFLGERDGLLQPEIRTVEFEKSDELLNYDPKKLSTTPTKLMDHSTEKWTQYFLNNDEVLLLRELKLNHNLTIARDIMNVDVGIVTGENDFFLLNHNELRENELRDYSLPIVTRSNHVKGIFFTNSDERDMERNGNKAFLFTPPDVSFEKLPSPARNYVNRGEENKMNLGFKCRKRKRWYVVPSIWTPDAFMLRQIHSYPKLIVNNTPSTCTDTIHRVRFLTNVNREHLACAFINSLTFAFSEVLGRSYGGGLLELEPNEAERLPLPLTNASKLNPSKIDEMVRAGEIEAILDMNDKILLVDGLGLSQRKVNKLRTIWTKLRGRRIGRKK